MKVSVERLPKDIFHVSLEGRLDSAGTQAAEADFNAATSAGPNIIVDISKVPFVSSLGIRLLVTRAKSRLAVDGKNFHMVLVCPDELARKSLRTTGVNLFVPIFESLGEAIASFEASGA